MVYIKKLVLIVMCCIFFLCPQIVFADYDCYYNANVEAKSIFKSKDEIEVYFRVLQDEKKFEIKSFLGITTIPQVIDSYLNSEYTDEYTIEVLDGKCPSKIYACRAESFHVPGSSYTEFNYMILNPSLLMNLDCDPFCSYPPDNSFFYRDEDCAIAEINPDKTTAGIAEVDFECDRYNTYFDELKDLCETSKNKSCSSVKGYKGKREQLIEYCNRIMQFSDYIDPCIDSCLHLSEDLASIEGSDGGNLPCGFTERLKNWIQNILRIMRYALPVLIIILSIVDFIKAIASNKEENMKKAQGNFVKRLIVAAVLYLVPLLIGFVLDKMGFSANSCGLW